MKDSFIYESLRESLQKLPGDLEIKAWKHESLCPDNRGRHDAQVQLGSSPMSWLERKENMSTAVVEQVILCRKEEEVPILLFAPYVSPVYANRLSENGIWFVDETGNAHLTWEGTYVFISREVPKKNRPNEAAMKPRKDFTPSMLKILYAFLVDKSVGSEALINQPYRRIHEKTGVSVGAIGGMIESLISQDFIVERGNRDRQLLQKEKLMLRWAEDYGRKLRPKLVKEHYRLPHPAWAESLNQVEAPGLWGGEVAGARLTGYLIPETVTLYTSQLPGDFILEHDLRKDPVGRVEVLRPFWLEDQTSSKDTCVHPLIIYADLMATGINRNLETAQRLYEKHLRSLATSN